MGILNEQEERCAQVLEEISDRVRRGEISAVTVVLQTKKEGEAEVKTSHPILAVTVHLLSRGLTMVATEMIKRHYSSNLGAPPEPFSE